MVAGSSWSVKKLVLVASGEDRTSDGVEPLGWEWGARKESRDQVEGNDAQVEKQNWNPHTRRSDSYQGNASGTKQATTLRSENSLMNLPAFRRPRSSLIFDGIVPNQTRAQSFESAGRAASLDWRQAPVPLRVQTRRH